MNFGIVYKEDNEKAKKLSGEIADYLESKNHKVADTENLDDSDYILSVGGDGTLIHKACEYLELGIPFVGINVGRLGFLTAVEGDNWKEAIGRLEKNELFISERIMLSARVGNRDFRAVNEVVVKGLYRVVGLDVDVDGENLAKVTGDGVIVATQTGSTAYSLSSGGPIVDADLDAILITPINPIGLPVPSIVVSPDDELKVKVETGDDVSLIIDGQEHTKLSVGDEILITKGKQRVKFGYFDKHHFLKSLNAKFGLSGRVKV